MPVKYRFNTPNIRNEINVRHNLYKIFIYIFRNLLPRFYRNYNFLLFKMEKSYFLPCLLTGPDTSLIIKYETMRVNKNN